MELENITKMHIKKEDLYAESIRNSAATLMSPDHDFLC